MRKIGIWGWFGFRNCGDDLLLLNTVSEIESCAAGDDRITVFGDSENIRKLFPSRAIDTSDRSASSLLKYACKADILIVGPGGLFPSENTIKLIFYLLLTLVMKLRRKRIGFIGVGIGIGMFRKKRDIFLLNLITKLADVFVSRSMNYLSFSPRLKENRILLSSDMIFSDPIVSSSVSDTSSHTVLLALADVFESNTSEYKERFISEIIALISHIVSKGYCVKLVSFTNEKDMALNDLIAERMNNDAVRSLPFCENPYDTFKLIKDADLCVGMRFHSLVMALSCGIPCLSISYSDKNEDVMSRFGLSDYSLRFGISKSEYYNEEIMINSALLTEKFDEMNLHREELKQRILAKKQENYEASLVNRAEIHHLMKEE